LQRPDIQVDLADTEYGVTPPAAVVAEGRVLIVEQLIQTGRADANAPNPWRRTPIFHAVFRQNSAILEILLADDRLDLSWQDGHGRTPLIYSVSKRQTDVTKMLLRHPKPYVGIRDPDGRTPLHLAAENGDLTIVRVLLNHTEVDLHAQNRWGSTALHCAAKRGHLAVVKLLLAELSIDINAKDRNDATPLWWATRDNYEHVAARLLAEPNADINAVGHFERPLPDRSTSLHHAVQGRSDLIIRLLLMEKSLDPNILDHQGRTPLGWAACQGDVETVEWLLTRRAIQVNAVNQNEQPPLWLAAWHDISKWFDSCYSAEILTLTKVGEGMCHHTWQPSLQATRMWQ
jgi:ankyrin repeat protein